MDHKPSWVADVVWHSGYCPFPNVVLLAGLRLASTFCVPQVHPLCGTFLCLDFVMLPGDLDCHQCEFS